MGDAHDTHRRHCVDGRQQRQHVRLPNNGWFLRSFIYHSVLFSLFGCSTQKRIFFFLLACLLLQEDVRELGRAEQMEMITAIPSRLHTTTDRGTVDYPSLSSQSGFSVQALAVIGSGAQERIGFEDAPFSPMYPTSSPGEFAVSHPTIVEDVLPRTVVSILSFFVVSFIVSFLTTVTHFLTFSLCVNRNHRRQMQVRGRVPL